MAVEEAEEAGRQKYDPEHFHATHSPFLSALRRSKLQSATAGDGDPPRLAGKNRQIQPSL